jgi:hypothetical protein
MCVLGAIASSTLSAAELTPLEQDKQVLAPLQAYVGEWRGIGLPKRGSNQGAWSETAQWSWKFAEERASLVAMLEPGKFFERLEVRPDAKSTALVVDAFVAKSPATPAVRYHGELKDGELVAVAEDSPEGLPARITIRLVADGDRMFVLYERRLSADSFARLAEVGSTRKGSSFAKRAASGPECVVTGGLGTIEVEYEGKSYFVCCSGCKDLFEEDPAGVLADYHERKAAEKAQPQSD